MIGFTVQQRKVNELSKVLKGSDKKIRRQLAIAVNATSKKTTGGIAKQVATELATAQKNIKKTIKIKQKASNNQKVPTAVVSLIKGDRTPLKDFKPRQNKKGVTYKISTSKGKRLIPGAFIVDSLGGHVFQRRGAKAKVRRGRNAGQMKQKIFKLFGVSPWGVFVKREMKKPVVKESKKELIKQIERRIRFLKLKESGAI